MGSGDQPGYQRVAVVGAGVIGISWAAEFLAHGMQVTVCDPVPDVEERVRAGLREIAPTLAQLGLPVGDLTDGTDALRFEPAVTSAVAGADFVQENGPERPDLKKELWSQIEAGAPADALFASSSSGRWQDSFRPSTWGAGLAASPTSSCTSARRWKPCGRHLARRALMPTLSVCSPRRRRTSAGR
jgi:NADPH-dependent 2,4-dienoyl-CoA reductase/sulfur reductase-like enzyme